MDLDFFVKGAIVGFSIAAPVGPIGLLCIRRTLAFGRFSGLFSGMGASLSSMFFGLILVSGLTLISDSLLKGQFWLHLIGGLFLIYLGIKTYFAKPNDMTRIISHKTLFADFLSTFFLNITNPITIIAYLAVFTSFGLTNLNGTWSSNSLLVFGIFVGATCWWLILSGSVSLFRKKVNQTAMIWINRITGIAITAFGIFAWWSILK